MVFDDDVGVFFLDHLCELSQESRLSDACHVLQTDLLSASSDLLVGELGVIVQRMDRRGGDAQRALRGHSALLSPFDGRGDVTDVVQTVEDTGDIGALCMLHAIHHGAYVVGHGIHAESIETTVKHVGLDAGGVQWCREGAHSFIGVFTSQQLHLLKGSAVGLYT